MKSDLIIFLIIACLFGAGCILCVFASKKRIADLKEENEKLKCFNNSALNPQVIYKYENPIQLIRCKVSLPDEVLFDIKFQGRYAREKISCQIGEEILKYAHVKVWQDKYTEKLCCEARIEIVQGKKAGLLEWRVPEGYRPDSLIKEDISL